GVVPKDGPQELDDADPREKCKPGDGERPDDEDDRRLGRPKGDRQPAADYGEGDEQPEPIGPGFGAVRPAELARDPFRGGRGKRHERPLIPGTTGVLPSQSNGPQRPAIVSW